MKTSFRTQYGPPSVLSIREMPIPEPKAGELCVRVRAATVNRTDCGVLFGEPYLFRFFVGWPKPRKAATGTDFAGEVVALGSGVTRFAVGDRVMGFDDNNLGSHAEYLCLSAQNALIHIPEGVSFEHAAASIEGAHYARNFISKVTVKAGDKVLVYGATGAIGSAAVALLYHAGVRVTAVCPEAHFAAVKKLGAERTVDFAGGRWLSELKGEQFAHVFDAVGKQTFAVCRPFLANTGAYISSELGPGGQNITYSLLAPLMWGPKVRFPLPMGIPESLELVAGLLAEGKYTPLIDRRFALEEIVKAFEYVSSGQKIGNVLLIPS
ncbi:MAG: NAD(P)-dependent alcohol dehydrogenase [Candidatus Sericytochromatia bacterium]|nr:NAD(P)-dependent alcohol dehydrogenase [Candidatus Sericytochromatia bacterium]